MKKIIAALFTSVLISFAGTSQSFTINGYTTGISDSNWIYLSLNGGISLDSSQVINGRFSMSGSVQGDPLEVFIHTSQYKNYTVFWLENKPYHLFLKDRQFKQGIILGSPLEQEKKVFYAQINYLRGLADSLTSLIGATRDTAVKALLKQERKKIAQDIVDQEVNYVANHPQSIIAANTLNIYKTTWDKDLVASLYSNMTERVQQSHFGKNIKKFLTLHKPHLVGDKYSDITQPDVKGTMKSLSKVKAKYILLEFWASWCQPCREENPQLVATYNKYKSKGFEIFGVSLDNSAAAWKEAIKKDGLTWENVSELTGDENTAFIQYGGNGVPANFLIDAAGTIIAKDLRGDKLAAKLKELLSK